MRVRLSWHFEITSAVNDDELADHVDCVMRHLLDLEGGEYEVSDAAIGLDSDRGHVEIDLVLEAAGLEQAIPASQAVIRCAVHAAGGYTVNWDSERRPVEYDMLDVTLEPVPVAVAA